MFSPYFFITFPGTLSMFCGV